MNFFNRIKERIQSYAEENKERREFQELVRKETLPIRREAYLKQKLSQAIEEGKAIAEKEFLAKKQSEKKTREDFQIPSGKKNQWEPEMFKDKIKQGGKK